MSEFQILEHKIGTDSVFVVPVTTTNHETEDVGPTDLSGAYIYFQIFAADGTTLILDLNNDPSGVNTGIFVRSPASGGFFEAAVPHEAMAAAAEGDRLPYVVLVRLDPGGVDDRHEYEGAIKIVKGKAVVP